MVWRRKRLFATAIVLFSAVLATGCGELPDEQELPRADASVPPVASQDADQQMTVLDGGGLPSPTQDTGILPAEVSPLTPTTLVVLPDTQYYSAAYPEVFQQQTSWILSQRRALNIAAVLHVGDLVDGDTPQQWQVANSAMRVLDGVLPYVLAIGNHDCDENRRTMMNDYFGPATMPWITGTMLTGRIENSYTLANLGGRQWLILSLEFGPRNAVVAWADAILKALPTTPTMLLTHAYLYRDGTRYDITKGGTDPSSPNYQYFSPAVSGFTASEGINDGEMLWQKLVLPNPNVRLVFCGHDTGGARLSSTRPDGSVVHQMLSDYQWMDGEDFGFGYLRILRLDYAGRTITVQTYSPYLQSYLTDGDNQFILPLYF